MREVIAQFRPLTLYVIACTTAVGMGMSHGATAAAVTVDTSQATVLVESSHNPSQTQTVRATVALSDGGIFATGVRDKEHLWSLKVAADGSLAWKTMFSAPTLENAFIAAVLPEGGYWIAGVATTRDVSKQTAGNPNWGQVLQSVQFDYIRRFDANGTAAEILPVHRSVRTT